MRWVRGRTATAERRVHCSLSSVEGKDGGFIRSKLEHQLSPIMLFCSVRKAVNESTGLFTETVQGGQWSRQLELIGWLIEWRQRAPYLNEAVILTQTQCFFSFLNQVVYVPTSNLTLTILSLTTIISILSFNFEGQQMPSGKEQASNVLKPCFKLSTVE